MLVAISVEPPVSAERPRFGKKYDALKGRVLYRHWWIIRFVLVSPEQDTLDKLHTLTYVPCAPKLDLLDALAEAGANPAKSCIQASDVVNFNE